MLSVWRVAPRCPRPLSINNLSPALRQGDSPTLDSPRARATAVRTSARALRDSDRQAESETAAPRTNAHSARNTAFGAAQSRARALARLLVAGCGGGHLSAAYVWALARSRPRDVSKSCTGCRVEALIQYDLSMNMSIAVVNAGWSTNKASVTVKGEIS